MEPIDLEVDRDLFERFLAESDLREQWQLLEAERGPIQILTYKNS